MQPPGQVLSADEQARRERQRLAAVSSVVDYDWSEDSRRLLIPAGGALYIANATSGAVKRLDQIPPAVTDARLSPHGRFASYVRDQNLYVLDLSGGGEERAITTAGGGAVSYGVAEFVAQEEMGRYTGYW